MGYTREAGERKGKPMNHKKVLAGTSAVALAAGLGAGVTPANAKKGTTPLSEVIADNSDFDVLTGAVGAVLADNPDSAVSVLTDGSVKLTAFAPTDKAFKNLATTLSGKKVKSDDKALAVVAGLGLETVETVLLYHVVPGAYITGKKALKSNQAKLATAADGLTVKVKVKKKKGQIFLKDRAPELKNPKVVIPDINKGNKQIAHAINNVLLPIQP